MLAAWLAAVAGLGLLGTGVEGRLTQSIFVIPGTETDRAIELSSQEFDDSVFVPVLLEGPATEIERQGPALVTAISSRADTRVLSPWDRGSLVGSLRPRPDAAMVLVAIDRPYAEIFDETAEEIRGLVDSQVTAPVEARITGMPVIGNAIKDETYSSAREAEWIAIPILLVVLLFVFRAPIAALIPAITGLAAVVSAAGAIWLAAGPLSIDPIAITLASMMGLALGVDYSLLIVTRFREELAAGIGSRKAALATVGTAGRTVAFAGGALVVAMLVGMAVSPGNLLVSAAVGVLASTLISVASALTAIPAALSLLGGGIDRWWIGRRRSADTSPRWASLARLALVRPGVVAVAIAVPLLVLAAPALGLNTGPPDVAQLPEDNRAREDFERVGEVMGPGWAAPFELILVGNQGTITEPRRLEALERWQRNEVDAENVASVIGPGSLAAEGRAARRAGGSLQRGSRNLGRVATGIRTAEQRVRGLAAAQLDAADAIGQLAEEEQGAVAGAAELAAQLGAAAGGADLINGALGSLAAASEPLLDALGRGRSSSARLVLALGLARDRAHFEAASVAGLLGDSLRFQAGEVEGLVPHVNSAQNQLAQALAELDAMGIGKTDPRYAAVLNAVGGAYSQISGRDPGTGAQTEEGYDGLERELGLTRDRAVGSAAEADRLQRGTLRLARGIARAERGARELRRGLGELRDEAAGLLDGVERIRGAVVGLREGVAALAGGADELSGGLGTLAGGAAALSARANEGRSQVGALVLGLGDAARGTRRLDRRTGRALDGRLDSGLFDSGYFVLSAIDTASSSEQAQAQIVASVDSGGEAGRILVVPGSAPNDDATRDLRDSLSEKAERLGDRLGADTAVGGTAAALAEYDEATSQRLLWLILALAVVSYVVLVPIFRSVVLPAIAVLLNLISVGAAFGAMALLFQGSEPPLGGPGYVDAVAISAIYTVIFGLSLDYQVFLITRMREGWLREGETESAIAYGLDRTATVVTGAAAIMVAVFLVFATTEVAGTRQFGVGLAIAVVVDATLVRLMLLPAAMRLAGDLCWLLPASLDRRLPRADVL